MLDFLHVSQCCLDLGGEMLVYSFGSESWPPYVVTSLDGADPGCLDGVSGRRMVIIDEVGDCSWYLSCCCICRVGQSAGCLAK